MPAILFFGVGEVDEKDVAALVQVGGLQHLVGFEHPVGLDVEFGDVVLRVFEDQPGNRSARAKIQRRAEGGGDEQLRHPAKPSPLPLAPC